MLHAVELGAYIGEKVSAKIGGRTKNLWRAQLDHDFLDLKDLAFLLGPGWTECTRQNAMERNVVIKLHPEMLNLVELKYSFLTQVGWSAWSISYECVPFRACGMGAGGRTTGAGSRGLWSGCRWPHDWAGAAQRLWSGYRWPHVCRGNAQWMWSVHDWLHGCGGAAQRLWSGCRWHGRTTGVGLHRACGVSASGRTTGAGLH